MTSKLLIGSLAGLAMAGLATIANAGSDLEKALAAGAERLTSNEIAERLTGKTGLFLVGGGDKRIMIYYGENNELVAKPVGGDSVLTGFYAVTDRDTICIGWDKKDLPRLRCLDALLLDGVVYKYNTDGSFSGSYEKFEDGKIL